MRFPCPAALIEIPQKEIKRLAGTHRANYVSRHIFIRHCRIALLTTLRQCRMYSSMQTVISTPEFLSQAKKLKLSQDEIDSIVETLADDPLAGDIISQTGGARKQRHAGRGGGKSGGYRTIHYFGGVDAPVFILTVYGKGDKANLTKAKRNQLAKILPQLADHYRATAKAMAAKRDRRK